MLLFQKSWWFAINISPLRDKNIQKDEANQKIEDQNLDSSPILIESDYAKIKVQEKNQYNFRFDSKSRSQILIVSTKSFTNKSDFNGFDYCLLDKEKFNDGERVSIMPICNHLFHEACFKKYLETNSYNCPECFIAIPEVD